LSIYFARRLRSPLIAYLALQFGDLFIGAVSVAAAGKNLGSTMFPIALQPIDFSNLANCLLTGSIRITVDCAHYFLLHV
jgi:hypothetical protein